MGFRYSFAAKNENPFDCEKCADEEKQTRNCCNRLKLREVTLAVNAYSEEIKDELQETNAAKVFSCGGIRLYECPLSYLTADTLEIIRFIFLIENSGYLLHAGGWGDQPAWLVESFVIFKAEEAKIKKQ